MFKTNFYKTMKGYKFELAHGYGENLTAPDGTVIELRLEKQATGWRVTEASTGLALTFEDFNTRKEAIEAFDSEQLQKLSDILKTEKTMKLAKQLSDYILSQANKREDN